MKNNKLEIAQYFYDAQQLNKSIDRFYLGNEFCELQLPSIRKITKILRLLEKRKKKATLVLPPISSFFIKKIESLIKSYSKYLPEGEVVVNDWGMLGFLSKNYLNLEPVIGRLITHQPLYTGHKHKFIQDKIGKIEVDEVKKIIKNNNIKRIELNNSFKLIDPYDNIFNMNFIGNLNYPYVYLTSALHNCAFQYCEDKNINLENPLSCRINCERYALIFSYEKKYNLFKEFDGNIILKGKTKFLKIDNLKNLKQKWINRLVVHPSVGINDVLKCKYTNK